MCKYLLILPEILYHGTTSVKDEYVSLADVEKINVNRCSRLTDFSQGFYLTSVYIQSLAWARRLSNALNDVRKGSTIPKIIKYKFDLQAAKNLNGMFFHYPDNKWAEFVYNNRIGDEKYIYSDFHNINKEYDYVYGHLADGIIFDIINSYKKCRHSFDMIESFRKEIHPRHQKNNDQLSLHSKLAVKCLKFLKVIEDEKYNPNHR